MLAAQDVSVPDGGRFDYAAHNVLGTHNLGQAEFVPDDVHWVHLDIAGPAYNNGAPWGYTAKGGTGVPVRTLIAVLEDIAAEG